jgi:hypothetical protein
VLSRYNKDRRASPDIRFVAHCAAACFHVVSAYFGGDSASGILGFFFFDDLDGHVAFNRAADSPKFGHPCQSYFK